MNRKTGEQSVSEKLEKAREYEKINRRRFLSKKTGVSYHTTDWLDE